MRLVPVGPWRARCRTLQKNKANNHIRVFCSLGAFLGSVREK